MTSKYGNQMMTNKNKTANATLSARNGREGDKRNAKRRKREREGGRGSYNDRKTILIVVIYVRIDVHTLIFYLYNLLSPFVISGLLVLTSSSWIRHRVARRIFTYATSVCVRSFVCVFQFSETIVRIIVKHMQCVGIRLEFV